MTRLESMESYQPRSDLLKDRVILVTGCSEGIGRACALACAVHGATVIISDQTEEDVADLYDQIVTSGLPEPAILPLNMETAGEEYCARMALTMHEEFGRLDGLVHCGAFTPFLSRIDDYDADEWERVIRINLTTPFLLTQACMPLLRQSRDASVVFTSDRVGRKGLAYWGAFAAAKFGIEGLMQTLAEETDSSSQIRANSIDPGVVRTGLRARLYPGENPYELPGPETIMDQYLYLLGPDSKGVTGQTLSAFAAI